MKFFVILSSLLIFLVILSGCTDTVTPNISDVNYFADVNYSLENDTNNIDNNTFDANTIVPLPEDYNFSNFIIDLDTCVRGCKFEEIDSITCTKDCFNKLTLGVERTQVLKLISQCIGVCRKSGGEQYACISTCRGTPLSPVEKCIQACIPQGNTFPFCNEECKKDANLYIVDSNVSQDTNTVSGDNNIPLVVDQNE